MIGSLFDGTGRRKYLVAKERSSFVRVAYEAGNEVGTFCLMLAFTGARISEVLALTSDRIDPANGLVVFETLKRRKRGVYRAVPLPQKLIILIVRVHKLKQLSHSPTFRLWNWGRTTAWKRVKAVMLAASIEERLATPRAARHAFGAGAVERCVALNIIQRWMGHARIETTAIYANVMGREERLLAARTWKGLLP